MRTCSGSGRQVHLRGSLSLKGTSRRRSCHSQRLRWPPCHSRPRYTIIRPTCSSHLPQNLRPAPMRAGRPTLRSGSPSKACQRPPRCQHRSWMRAVTLCAACPCSCGAASRNIVLNKLFHTCWKQVEAVLAVLHGPNGCFRRWHVWHPASKIPGLIRMHIDLLNLH